MGYGDQFDFYKYQSDDGDNYAIKLSQNIATAGGFTETVNPLTLGVWPFGGDAVRHVYGVDSSTDKRTKLPIQNPSNALYQSGGSFPLHSKTYTVEGAIGEKRRLNHIG